MSEERLEELQKAAAEARAQDLGGFRSLEFMGFHVWGSGFRVLGFRV